MKIRSNQLIIRQLSKGRYPTKGVCSYVVCTDLICLFFFRFTSFMNFVFMQAQDDCAFVMGLFEVVI